MIIAMTELLNSVWLIALLIVGFGFIVFWHELGHFLAAKWVGIKVEQFALGFGPAILSWRKGMGLQWGSSGKKLDELHKAQESGTAGVEIGRYGETEYRWNWVPLGGYVKMLGQDDMRPVHSDDARSYNRKSVGARMLVVSAGVIMNIILAAIGFVILFRVGFDVPPPYVGGVEVGSPADRAGLKVGDYIEEIDGTVQYDFMRIPMSVALSDPGKPIVVKVRRANGTIETVEMRPSTGNRLYEGLLTIGIEQPRQLNFSPQLRGALDILRDPELSRSAFRTVEPGDRITHINGKAVADPKDYPALYRAMQEGGGKPVELTLNGNKTISVPVNFQKPFGSAEINFAGLTPRPRIVLIQSTSTARGKLLPGDVVVRMVGIDPVDNPNVDELMRQIRKAGETESPFSLTVIRDGRLLPPIEGLLPTVNLGQEKKKAVRGLGIGLESDTGVPVIADVLPGSAAESAKSASDPAKAAALPRGATITRVDGKPVATWFDVWHQMKDARPDVPLPIETEYEGRTQVAAITLSAEELSRLRSYRLNNESLLGIASYLQPYKAPRHTTSTLTAIKWGVRETRDITLQFYLTLRRMTQGSIPADQIMGPIRMATTGWSVANRGHDWLLWFLSLISANLAVVNFLPVPIVDGGLFLFLIIEKIMGKPLSPRVQGVVQYLGLAMLAGVFLFVTYNDIRSLL